jgi:PPOX class probable F420-dependent enzyme
MPSLPVPDAYLPLLTEPVLGHLATINPEGAPEVNPVWFLWQDGQILISVQGRTRKYRNMRENSHVALSIVDPNDPYRYLELRGKVADLKLYTDLSFVNLLARKYTGADYGADSVPGIERYRVTILVDRWTGQ